MGKNWDLYSAAAWDICVELAATKNDTTDYVQIEMDTRYRPYRKYKKRDGSWANKFLFPIAEECRKNNWPILSLMVTKKNGKYGKGVLPYLSKSLADELNAVRTFDWTTIENPFSKEIDQALAEKLLSASPKERKALFTVISQRGNSQRVFRQALLKLYSKCAVCSVNQYELLEAAHIKPWRSASDKERVDPANGLLLCANHHKAFDRGFWWLNSRLSVEMTQEFSTSDLGKRTLGELAYRGEHKPKKKYINHLEERDQ